ncbi:HNH endonuclease [Bacillus cereus group sp. Bce026]|uniref:HNH endonuclease n=1 Tax=Bacillus cereus group sp. Bce026 TaxID=3445242 RepID=UPI003F27D0AD
MTKNIEENNSHFKNAAWRYFAVVFGKYIEEGLSIANKDWRTTGWNKVLKEFDERCIYCNKKRSSTVRLQKEHLNSISTGGLDIKANVLPACSKCNQQKGNEKKWRDFLKEKSKPNKKQAENRIKKIEKYRVNHCDWQGVQQHKMYQESKGFFERYSGDLESSAFKWITNLLYHDELSRYVYHITTLSTWEEAKNSGQYPPKGSSKVKVKCSYEDNLPVTGLKYAISNCATPDSELVILSFDLTNFRIADHYTRVYLPGETENFIDILIATQIKNIRASKPFSINKPTDIKEALSDIVWSLSHKRIKLPGSDFK